MLPFALFDFRRWLVGRVSHKRSRWFMSGLIGASFLAGLAIGSNLSICFKESGPPSASASEGAVFTDEVASCWGSGDPMLGLGVGLLAAYTGLVLDLADPQRPENDEDVAGIESHRLRLA